MFLMIFHTLKVSINVTTLRSILFVLFLSANIQLVSNFVSYNRFLISHTECILASCLINKCANCFFKEPYAQEGVGDAEPEADVRGGADGSARQGLPQPHEHHHRRGQASAFH